MSLLIHIPLNKDLTQQGLSDATVTNNGAALNDNGKLGKCYYFDGGSNIVATLPATISSSVGSLACWVKFNSLPTASGFYCLMQLGNLGGYATSRLGLYMEYSNYINISIDGSSTGTNRYTHSMVANQWYHLCTTYDDTTVKLYIDGTEVLSKTANKSTYTTNASYLYLGGTSAYYLKGCMNDARYYSHALSAKEVKALSQGLVCHYPLNGNGRSGENLYTEPYWKYSTTKWGYAAQVGTVKPVLNTDGSVTFTGGGGTNSQCYIHHISNRVTISASTTYTVSCKVTASGSGTFKIYLYQYDSSGAKVGNIITTTHSFVDGETKTISNTITTTSTTASFYAELNMYGSPTTSTMLLHANSLKIEKSDHPTPWMPSIYDSAYTSMGYNSTTEYDVSGYKYNGTKNGLTYNSDTPRYSVSTYFDNTQSSRILTSNFTIGNEWSFGMWLKPPTTARGWEAIAILNTNSGDGDTQMGLYLYKNSSYIEFVCNTQTAIITSYSFDGNWHHIFGTFDGTTLKGYIDGELKITKEITHALLSRTNLGIGGRRSSSDTSFGDYYLGNMSDFRIYATALSADDVKELYNTVASIANNGTLLTRGEISEL